MKTFRDVPYTVVNGRTLFLDIYLPAAPIITPVPLVMFLPIGGMRVCSRANPPTWLVEHGFALANVDLRVSSEAIAPASADDGRAAIRFLQANAGKFGFAADKIAAWGHSAGGLLASLLATSGAGLTAACDQCGAPHDLTYFTRPEIKARFPGVYGNLSSWLGGPVEDRLALARQVSATTYISAQTPPLLLVHGEADNVVPWEETAAFHAALQRAGVDSTLHVLKGVGHGIPLEKIRDLIVNFFARTLAGR